LGAAYVVTGSVNQCSTDAALSPAAKALLAGAGFADMAMAPSADMFELGAKVQVLKRGTMFAARATRLYELYRNYPDLESLPRSEREVLEKTYFRRPIEEVWQDTQRFFAARAPEQLDLAARDPKHRMALVFRWYLGRSSRWAIDGVADRVMDYQIWCGPAMGAFNAWARGSFLEPLANRDVVQIALNLLEGAAVMSRAQQLRALGVQLPVAAFDFRPRPLQA
jgi:PfaD family protein